MTHEVIHYAVQTVIRDTYERIEYVQFVRLRDENHTHN